MLVSYSLTSSRCIEKKSGRPSQLIPDTASENALFLWKKPWVLIFFIMTGTAPVGRPIGSTSTFEGAGSGFEPRVWRVYFINLRRTSKRDTKQKAPGLSKQNSTVVADESRRPQGILNSTRNKKNPGNNWSQCNNRHYDHERCSTG